MVYPVLIVAFSSFALVSPNFFFFLNWFVSITLHTLIRGMYSVVAVVVRRGSTVVVVVVVVRRGALVVDGILKCCDGWLKTGSLSSSMLSNL